MTSRRAKPLSAEDLAAWRRLSETLDRKFREDHEPLFEPPAPPAAQPLQPASQPLAPQPKRRLEHQPKPEPTWRQTAARPLIAPEPSDGVDRRTARRLKRGDLKPSARIDLHGMTETRAHQALIGFIHREFAHGSRWVLIITGKGRSNDAGGDWARIGGSTRGVLARLAPIWLSQPPLSGMVTNVVQAPRNRGGEGAIYVSLRRSHR